MNRFQEIKAAPSAINQSKGNRSLKSNQTKNQKSKNQPAKAQEAFVPRLFGQRTPSQLFRVSKILRRQAKQQDSKVSRPVRHYIPRLFGKRTPSQLFFISKITQKQGQTKEKRHQNKPQAKTIVSFVPSLFGQRTPSQLLLLSKNAAPKANLKAKLSAKKQHRIHATTIENGYLTPSRLLDPYRIKRERYFTLGRKNRMTPSALHLAYAKQHKFRPSLYGGHTASQLFTVVDRQKLRSEADQQFDLNAGHPTISQLGLNRRVLKAKMRPVQHHAPSSKLLKHLNQLPMEKNRKLDDALSGLTASQLLLLSDSTKSKASHTKKNNAKAPKRPDNRKFEAQEKSGLMPLLFGI